MNRPRGAARPPKAKARPSPPRDAAWSDWSSLDPDAEYDFGARLWGDPEGSTYSLRGLREQLAARVGAALEMVRAVGEARDDFPALGHLIPLRRGLHALANRATFAAADAQAQLTEYLLALIDLTEVALEAFHRGDLVARDTRIGRKLRPPQCRPQQFVARQFLGALPPDATSNAMLHAAAIVAQPPIFRAVDALRHDIAHDVHWTGVYVSRDEFFRWAESAGLMTHADRRCLDATIVDATAAPPVRRKVTVERIEFIVAELSKLGLDPMALPPSKPRDPGSPKSRVRKIALSNRGLFNTETDFRNAWDQARTGRSIRSP